MRLRRILAPLVMAAAMTSGGVAATSAAEPASAGPVHVTISGYAFTPASVTVVVGQTVVWTNEDQAPHNATSTSGPVSFTGATLHKGQSWQWVAPAAGTYRYICSVHPDMRAQLVVRAAATPIPSAAPAVGHRAALSQPHPHASARRTVATAPPSPSASALGPVTSTASTRAAVDPTLLIVGIAVGATVFCLLVIASWRRSS